MLSDHMVLRQAYNAETARNYTKAAFLGAGALGIVGLAGAAMIWASNQKVDPAIQAAAFREALADAPALKMDPDATVSVTQRKPLEVTASTPLKVQGTVGVSGKVGIDGPVTLPSMQGQNNDPAIKREVTVFNERTVNNHPVMTAWNYPSGSAQRPTYQFCYIPFKNADGSTTNVFLQNTNEGNVAVSSPLVTQYDAVQSRSQGCTWFQG